MGKQNLWKYWPKSRQTSVPEIIFNCPHAWQQSSRRCRFLLSVLVSASPMQKSPWLIFITSALYSCGMGYSDASASSQSDNCQNICVTLSIGPSFSFGPAEFTETLLESASAFRMISAEVKGKYFGIKNVHYTTMQKLLMGYISSWEKKQFVYNKQQVNGINSFTVEVVYQR